MGFLRLVLLILVVSFAGMAGLSAQDASSKRIERLEHQSGEIQEKLNQIARKSPGPGPGPVLFLFGAFCALWAQNTGRSAWLWFFFGMVCSVLAVIILLYKNSKIPKRRRVESAWR